MPTRIKIVGIPKKLLFIDSYTKYIKGVLVITPQDIKKKTSTKESNRTL